MDEQAAYVASLPLGMDLNDWSDPAPVAAPPFAWDGKQWEVVFDLLDGDQEKALARRLSLVPESDQFITSRQLRLAWSIHAINGAPFVPSIIQRALRLEALTQEETQDATAVQAACEAYMEPVKGPLLLALAQAYDIAAGRALGLLEAMRADPFSAREPSMPGESFAPEDAMSPRA